MTFFMAYGSWLITLFIAYDFVHGIWLCSWLMTLFNAYGFVHGLGLCLWLMDWINTASEKGVKEIASTQRHTLRKFEEQNEIISLVLSCLVLKLSCQGHQSSARARGQNFGGRPLRWLTNNDFRSKFIAKRQTIVKNILENHSWKFKVSITVLFYVVKLLK